MTNFDACVCELLVTGLVHPLDMGDSFVGPGGGDLWFWLDRGCGDIDAWQRLVFYGLFSTPHP